MAGVVPPDLSPLPLKKANSEISKNLDLPSLYF